MKLRVAAIGQDEYWLNAVRNAIADWLGELSIIKCTGELARCIPRLPKPGTGIILLADASGQGDMEQVVSELRARGWEYVIVVAADPSAKEATAVLRRNLGYDYWEKTYDEAEIRERVKICFEEINAKKGLRKQHHNSFE